MKRLIAVVLVLVSVAGFSAELSGSRTWNQNIDKVSKAAGFSEGYFDTVMDKFAWTEADKRAWAMISIQLVTAYLDRQVDAFYQDPANDSVSTVRAMRICLERLIAKTKDGPRLLAAIGVDVNQVATR